MPHSLKRQNIMRNRTDLKFVEQAAGRVSSNSVASFPPKGLATVVGRFQMAPAVCTPFTTRKTINFFSTAYTASRRTSCLHQTGHRRGERPLTARNDGG